MSSGRVSAVAIRANLSMEGTSPAGGSCAWLHADIASEKFSRRGGETPGRYSSSISLPMLSSRACCCAVGSLECFALPCGQALPGFLQPVRFVLPRCLDLADLVPDPGDLTDERRCRAGAECLDGEGDALDRC